MQLRWKIVRVILLLGFIWASLIALRSFVFPKGEFNFVNVWFVKKGMSEEATIDLLGLGEVVPQNKLPQVYDENRELQPVIRASKTIRWGDRTFGAEYLIVGFEDNYVVGIYHFVPMP